MSTHPTILLLEDDQMLLDLMRDGLSEDGFSVMALNDAAELPPALDRLDGQAILVADRNIGSASANGFDIASAALDRYPGLRVIYVSGTPIAVKRRTLSARERGLIKPFAISQLSGLARQLIRGSPHSHG